MSLGSQKYANRPPAQSTPRTGAERHQWIQRIGGAGIRREPHTLLGKQAFTLHSVEVKNAVSDRHSHSRPGACFASSKHPERQILDGKIRAGNVGGFNPTLHLGIVGLVENGFHSRCFIASVETVSRRWAP